MYRDQNGRWVRRRANRGDANGDGHGYRSTTDPSARHNAVLHDRHGHYDGEVVHVVTEQEGVPSTVQAVTPLHQLQRPDLPPVLPPLHSAANGNGPGLYYVSLTNVGNTVYYGDVSVGTPPQRIKAMFATGTADTWLPAASCTQWGCQTHSSFHSNNSRSYIETIARYNITYSTGTVQAQTAGDVFSIGGAELKQAPFGEIAGGDESFMRKYRYFPFDGIVGLSYAGAAVSRQIPIFDKLMKKKLVQQELFSLYLTQKPGQRGSQLILGGIDPRYHLDEVSYFPIEAPHIFWMLNITQVIVKESAATASSQFNRRNLVSLCDPQSQREHRDGGGNAPGAPHVCRAVIDSGTSLISGPSAAVDRIAKVVQVDPGCANLHELPQIMFNFYGSTFTLHPEDYVVKIPIMRGRESACFLGMTGYDFPPQMGPLWVLGNTFLKKYYTVFDRTRNQIGFAIARPDPPSAPNPTVAGGNGRSGGSAADVSMVSAALPGQAVIDGANGKDDDSDPLVATHKQLLQQADELKRIQAPVVVDHVATKFVTPHMHDPAQDLGSLPLPPPVPTAAGGGQNDQSDANDNADDSGEGISGTTRASLGLPPPLPQMPTPQVAATIPADETA